MIQHVKVDDGVKVWYSFENFKEIIKHFRPFSGMTEGDCYPHGYLAVSRENNRAGWTVWILPLAPFALLVVAITRGFREFWWTLIDAIDKWPKK